MHDWGDSAAVVHVPGTGATHLIDGTVAALLSQWDLPIEPPGLPEAADEDQALAQSLQAHLAQQLPVLVQAGILQPQPA